MNRSQFVISTALLVVSGTVAFVISFTGQESVQTTAASSSMASRERNLLAGTSQKKSHDMRSVSAGDREVLDDTFYEVSVAREEDRERADTIIEESREKLDKLTLRYKLTKLQRREVFPIIAGFSPLFRPDMIVNGQAVPHAEYLSEIASNPTAFEDTIYPLLDNFQQDRLQQDILNKGRWWEDVSHQLVDDLIDAIETGELVPETPVRPEEFSTEPPESTEPEAPAPISEEVE